MGKARIKRRKGCTFHGPVREVCILWRFMDGLLFLTGSCAYPTLEMIWRGRTHYSMALAGGLCLTLIGRICCGPLSHRSLALRCLTGSGIITGVELCTGLVVNNLLGFEVWDYRDMPLNILGQVCLPYSLLWCLLTLPAMALCDLLKGIKLD